MMSLEATKTFLHRASEISGLALHILGSLVSIPLQETCSSKRISFPSLSTRTLMVSFIAVLNKVFTEFIHIVAVKTKGNVFCYEAIKELNTKTKNWKELLTDEEFTREDLITIQIPNDLKSKALVEFDHVKKGLKLDDEELKKMETDPTYNTKVHGDIKQMLAELGTEKGKQAALLGGGGSKAQNEQAATLSALLGS